MPLWPSHRLIVNTVHFSRFVSSTDVTVATGKRQSWAAREHSGGEETSSGQEVPFALVIVAPSTALTTVESPLTWKCKVNPV